MNYTVHVRLGFSHIDILKDKESFGTLLEDEDLFREKLQDENMRNLFDGLMEQYQAWVMHRSRESFKSGFHGAINALEHVDGLLFSKPE